MKGIKTGTSWRAGAAALAFVVFAGALAAGSGTALADVSAVKGSAFGYWARGIKIFNGAEPDTGPAPAVTLATNASNSPQTASAPTGSVKYGPATLFSSGPITVTSSGNLGASGSVTSSTDIQNVNASGQEVFTASRLQSTCNATQNGTTGSTTVTGGTLQTSENGPVVVDVPANPAPNTTMHGKLETVGDTFTYIFNEQVKNADGSLTVTAAHEILEGPTATGDLFIGQSVCGATATATTTTAPGATTTTAAVGTTTTTASITTTTTSATTSTTATTTTTTPLATTTAPAPTTTADQPAASAVSGGAYGFSVTISLFGGAPATRGPEPSVTLPAGGSATPITASDPTGSAQFGPAILFTSDRIDVSTQGVPGPGGSVTSSATISNENRSGQEQFTAATIGSTCTASATGVSGSTSISGGKLITSEGDPNVEGDETIVDLPASPAPNTSFDAKLETVGDTFRVVLNEQRASGGSITVNAMHMYLLGPTSVGELVVGQSRCSLTAGGTGGSGAGGSAGSGGSGGGAASGLATTGSDNGFVALVALALIGAGWNATCLGRWRRARRVAAAQIRVGPAAPAIVDGRAAWRDRVRRWMSTQRR